VSYGEELRVDGYAGSPNDVYWEILTLDGVKIGESVFHLSCSDDDMNGAEDCGARQGDGKDQSGFLNDWILEGMVDTQGELDCNEGPPPEPEPVPRTLEVRIASGADDVEEQGPDSLGTPGAMYSYSTDLEMVRDDDPTSYGAQMIGLRFNHVTVPKGATVSQATIRFHAVSADSPNTNSDPTPLTIQGQAADSAPAFTTARYDLSTRARTTASVGWAPTAWSSGQDYETPDLTPLVDEIIGRELWVSGNSMVFVVRCSDGTPLASCGSRSAASYNGDASHAPLLHIEYTYP
jgi:hypothetical protein